MHFGCRVYKQHKIRHHLSVANLLRRSSHHRQCANTPPATPFRVQGSSKEDAVARLGGLIVLKVSSLSMSVELPGQPLNPKS